MVCCMDTERALRKGYCWHSTVYFLLLPSLKIYNWGRLITKLYDKCTDFTLLIVNFPFIGSNIPSSPPYGVYIE